MPGIPSPNPFIQAPLPREDETPQERTQREQEEARAKVVSDAIDEQIKQDKVAYRRYQKAIKILLLGQSESGQSASVPYRRRPYLTHVYRQIHDDQEYVFLLSTATLFQPETSIRFPAQVCIQRVGPRAELVEDRHVSMGPTSAHSILNHPITRVYPGRSHLNLIRSVTTILEIMSRVMKEQQDRIQLQQRSLSPSRSPRVGFTLPPGDREVSDDDADARDPVFNFSDKHKLLQLRLQPLTRVQKDIERYLGSAALEPDQVGASTYTVFPGAESPGSPRRPTEFSVSVNNPWKTRLSGKGEAKRLIQRKSSQDLDGATEILYRCGPDIKQLWADDVVQQVLKGTKARLEHSSGL